MSRTDVGGVPSEFRFDQMQAIITGDWRDEGGRLLENLEFLASPPLTLLAGRAARTGPRRRTGSSGPSADARHLTPLSRYFSPAEPDMAQRQERQIVQSQLNLDDFLP
ncbi:hypothetical protein [Candidatus Palauibacter sp.]|uniref:hypothetical protein n=1 Tax=Candidatus Palauibacter sp. TaxID=3101350 RepID=UPI003C6F7CBE